MKKFSCVFASEAMGGIGHEGGLPWPRLKEDMRRFKELTSSAEPGKKNMVIMGRVTWQSLPKALPGRVNVVLTRADTPFEGAIDFASLDTALAYAETREDIDKVFVIGGAQVYREAFTHPACREIFHTRISAAFSCDTFARIPAEFELVGLESFDDSGFHCCLETWQRS